MTQIEKATEIFIKEIKSTDAYRNYKLQKERIDRIPELSEKIDEFREKNLEFQNSEQSDEMFDKIDDFEKKYANFIENPLVSDFLTFELEFCRMMQQINLSITEQIDF